MGAADQPTTPGLSLAHKIGVLPTWRHDEGGEVINRVAALLVVNAHHLSASLDPVRQQVIKRLEQALKLKTFGIHLCADVPGGTANCRERFPINDAVWCANCRREADRDDAIKAALEIVKQEGGT